MNSDLIDIYLHIAQSYEKLAQPKKALEAYKEFFQRSSFLHKSSVSKEDMEFVEKRISELE